MALTKDLALEFLGKLEDDLKVVDVKVGAGVTNASIYNFAGYRDGQAVGISRTAILSLNRGGQILQFLAGFYTATTDVAIKNRIGKATAQVYNVFAKRAVFTVIGGNTDESDANFPTTGQFGKDPSGASMFIGLMMIDKQGVLGNSEFASNCIHTATYVRGTQIPRQAIKMNQALLNDQVTVNSLVNGENYTWATQKMAKLALNGTAMVLAGLSLYYKLYNVADYSTHYTQSYKLFRNVGTKFGTTYDSAGVEVPVTVAGASAGTKLCVAVGGNEQSRGAFPSVGYNAFVAMAMTLQAFAEKATTASTFSNLATAVANHPLQIDALKIVNYYRDRIASDGFAYELGAHRNFAYDAKRMRDSWKADLMSRLSLTADQAEAKFLPQAQFDYLLEKSNNKGMSGYTYGLMWVMPTHSVFTKLSDSFAYPASGKTTLDIDYSKVGSSASVAQAFASTGEASAVRIASGLGIALIQGVTDIK